MQSSVVKFLALINFSEDFCHLSLDLPFFCRPYGSQSKTCLGRLLSFILLPWPNFVSSFILSSGTFNSHPCLDFLFSYSIDCWDSEWSSYRIYFNSFYPFNLSGVLQVSASYESCEWTFHHGFVNLDFSILGYFTTLENTIETSYNFCFSQIDVVLPATYAMSVIEIQKTRQTLYFQVFCLLLNLPYRIPP